MVLRVRRLQRRDRALQQRDRSGRHGPVGRTEQAAANLEESAASMEQISSTVKHTAEHTDEASRVAAQNADVADRRRAVMADVVQTMEEIRRRRRASARSSAPSTASRSRPTSWRSTRRWKPRAPASRAAASRGGQRGAHAGATQRRGRTRDQGPDRRSVEQVEAGTGRAQGAGATIEEIVASSHRVNELLGEVATGAREQSLGHRPDRPGGAGARPHDAAERRAGGADRRGVAAMKDQAADSICRDDRCPLGQWLHGPGGAQWGSRPTFVALLERHAAFHVAAGDVARRINAGSYADAERLIGSGSPFASTSTEVATLLTRAKRGL
jgi:methyl-accepting chemotaxis protein